MYNRTARFAPSRTASPARRNRQPDRNHVGRRSHGEEAGAARHAVHAGAHLGWVRRHDGRRRALSARHAQGADADRQGLLGLGRFPRRLQWRARDGARRGAGRRPILLCIRGVQAHLPQDEQRRRSPAAALIVGLGAPPADITSLLRRLASSSPYANPRSHALALRRWERWPRALFASRLES